MYINNSTPSFKNIDSALNKDKVVSFLMIDVLAAYPKTSYQYLLHNFCKRKIDRKVIKWVASFSTNRQIIVKINEHTMPKLYTDLGLFQGLPLSFILYLFYNADLLNDCAKKRVTAQDYINDITLIFASKSVRDNTQKLVQVHNQLCKSWLVKHGLKFSLPKY